MSLLVADKQVGISYIYIYFLAQFVSYWKNHGVVLYHIPPFSESLIFV